MSGMCERFPKFIIYLDLYKSPKGISLSEY